MGGGFNRRKPSYTKRIHQHPSVVDIFRNHHWLGFFKILKGYDDDLAYGVLTKLHSQGEDSATIVVEGLAISLSPETISRVTTFPLGMRWSKEDKQMSVTARKNVFLSKENHVEDKNGVRREIMPYPLDEVAYHILKYIYYEGRLSVVYSYHFRLLHELSFKEDLPFYQILNVPDYIMHSIMEMSQKVREGKNQHLAHHCLIKLIVVDALNHLRILVLWNKVVDMGRDTL